MKFNKTISSSYPSLQNNAPFISSVYSVEEAMFNYQNESSRFPKPA